MSIKMQLPDVVRDSNDSTSLLADFSQPQLTPAQRGPEIVNLADDNIDCRLVAPELTQMRRLLSPIVLLLTLVSITAFGQMDDPLIAGVKPLIDIWSSCVLEAARGFAKRTESATTLAQTALFDCRNERDKVYRALFHERPSRSAELMSMLDGDLQKRATSMLSDARLK
jgi:hypothetical protein